MATAAININSDGQITDRAGLASAISASRIDTGLYEITGAQAIDTSLWWISVPLTQDGIPLVNVEHVSSDKHLRFCVRDSLVNPTDIPAGRVISLRLKV